MPLPWKKSRVTRISRLVADLQSSPRRGGSLVVETCFPTSLVDLFVKNRDRLRKPSRRKGEPELQISDPVLTSPLPAHLVVNPEPLDDPPPPPSAPEPAAAADREAAAEAGIGAVDGEIGGGCVGGSGKNSVFMAVFKVFVVVVLALSAKGLVIGVTMIAFLLLFLELVGKRVACLSRPCPDARMGFEGLIERVCAILSSVWPQKGSSVQRAITHFDTAEPTRETVVLGHSSSAVEEFRAVENKSEMVAVPVENNSSLGPAGESTSRHARWRRVDTGGEVRVVEAVEEEEGRGGLGTDAPKLNRKIKSKIIKRIVPKKLRTSKKGKKKECEPDPDASTAVASYLGDSGTGAGRQGEAEEEDGEQGEEDADKSRRSKAEAQCGNKGSDRSSAGETGSTPATISPAGPESETSAENARSAKKRRLVLAVVLLVVLAGLVGGRFLAFVLTFGFATTISIWASRRSFVQQRIDLGVPIHL